MDVTTDHSASVMEWLAAGVPISLLLDLQIPVDSRAIMTTEGGDAGWLLRATA
ncbi:MAG TPA: hypothetical protein VEZ46_06840 [Mycobacteriales bacterium]|jgi:hypothetical protein|nr:hypothetical protein [Mycobacteriales bacterium]